MQRCREGFTPHCCATHTVSGTARSDWGAQLVAQMFSFLETLRLQGGDAIAQLCELLSLAGRSPPCLHTT